MDKHDKQQYQHFDIDIVCSCERKNTIHDVDSYARHTNVVIDNNNIESMLLFTSSYINHIHNKETDTNS